MSSLCRLPWHSQSLRTILWIFTVGNFIQNDLKCVKSKQNFIYAPNWSTAFTASPVTKLVTAEWHRVETFCTEFYLNLSKNVKIMGRNLLKPEGNYICPWASFHKTGFRSKTFWRTSVPNFIKTEKLFCLLQKDGLTRTPCKGSFSCFLKRT